MTRPEAPIPGYRPMREVAEYLRHLRHEAGSPSYRTLGALMHLKQNSLSQTANGKRVGWGRVLLYVDALRRHKPTAVSIDDLAQLKKLHDAGEREHQRHISEGNRQRQSTALWEEIDGVIAQSAHAAARTRAPGQWSLTHGVTNVSKLNTARHRADLYYFLTEITEAHGIDLKMPAHSRFTRPKTAPFSWFGTTSAEPVAKPDTPQIRHPNELTLPLLLEVVQLCGGTDGDRLAWQSAWERIHRTPPDKTGSDQKPATPPPPDRITPALATQRLHRDSVLSRWPGNRMRRPTANGPAVFS